MVAEEIRKLAEQSSQAITNIQKVVEVINGSVANLVNGSKKMLEYIETEVNVDYQKLVEVGETYSKDAEYFTKLMVGFNNTSESLKDSVEHIADAIQQVSVTISQSAQGVENIASRTSDIVQNVVEIQEITHANLDRASELKSIASKFQF